MISLARYEARIQVADDRVAKIVQMFRDILDMRNLGPALAGQIFGQLGFACSQFFGRWRCARMRPISRQQHEGFRHGLIECPVTSALHWWLENLHKAPPH